MSTVALKEGLSWHDALMNKLHRGRGDKEKRVRGELSDVSGIPESYGNYIFDSPIIPG